MQLPSDTCLQQLGLQLDQGTGVGGDDHREECGKRAAYEYEPGDKPAAGIINYKISQYLAAEDAMVGQENLAALYFSPPQTL